MILMIIKSILSVFRFPVLFYTPIRNSHEFNFVFLFYVKHTNVKSNCLYYDSGDLNNAIKKKLVSCLNN